MSRSFGRTGFGLAVVMVVLATGCFDVQNANVFLLDVGQCFDDPTVETAEVSEVVIVECDSPHDNEVYSVFDLAASLYPGEEAVFDAAQRGCVERLAAYTGEPPSGRDLGTTFLAPTEQSWDNRDDREVVCYLFDLGGASLNGSMRANGV